MPRRAAIRAAKALAIVLGVGCGLIDRPAELDCAKVPLEVPDWLVRSCVLSVACSPFLPERTIGECIRGTEPLSTPYHACMKNALHCGDIAACRAYGRAPDETCAPGAKGWRCEGDVGIRCGYEEPWSVDCGQLGGHCLMYKDADKLSFWPCALSDTGCTGSSTWHCDGSRRVSCSGTTAWGHDCAATNATCVDDAKGAYCSAAEDTCAKPGRTCQGDQVQVCYETGVRATYDCAIAGGTCVDGMCEQAGCSYRGEWCHEGCTDATHMRVCLQSLWDYSGSPLTIDCAAHGFTRCIEIERKGNFAFATCR